MIDTTKTILFGTPVKITWSRTGNVIRPGRFHETIEKILGTDHMGNWWEAEATINHGRIIEINEDTVELSELKGQAM